MSSGSSLDPKFSGCPGPHVKTIRRSAEVARTILTRAITAIQRSMSNRWNRETYEMWFGRYSESRRTTVLRNFERMMDKLSFPGFTFDCNCGGPDPSDLSKYTLQLWWDRRSVTDDLLISRRAQTSHDLLSLLGPRATRGASG